MSLLARAIRENGFDTVNHGYQSWRYSIADHARMLHEKLSNNVEAGQPISFVTHSLGSLIARKFAHQYGSYYLLSRAVMLGPPNMGAQFALKVRKIPFVAKVLGKSFDDICNLDLAPATDILEVGIIAGGKVNDKGFSPLISGDNDGIVGVSETYLPGARDHKIVHMPHSFIMYSGQVKKDVIHFLNFGEFLRDS